MKRNTKFQVEENAKIQGVSILIEHQGRWYPVEEVTTKQFNQVKTVAIVNCERHPAAYSIEDVAAGKMSKATLLRRIAKNKHVCSACCRASGKSKTVRVKHNGALVYQKLEESLTEFDLEQQKLPKRSDIKKREQIIKLTCVSCRQPNQKSVNDIINTDRRLRHGFKLCSSCAQVSSTEHLKYSAADLKKAAETKGLVLKFISTRNGIIYPQANELRTKVSSSAQCELTCSIKSHQSRWEKTVTATVLLSGATGCKVCASAISRNEILALSLLTLFLPESQIAMHYTASNLKRQHYDFFLTQFGIAIEVDGSHHTDTTAFLHNERTSERDTRKEQLARDAYVTLIRLDASEVEKQKSTDALIAAAIRCFLKPLTDSAPAIFSEEIFSSLGFEKLFKATYISLSRELRARKCEAQEQEFIDYCNKVGIEIEGTYVNSTTDIAVRCSHHKTRNRKPVDIMAGHGKHCCRYDAKGAKATVERAIKMSALKGYLIDFNRTEPCLTDSSIRATTKFAISCACGKKHSDTANINGLQSTRYATCACAKAYDRIMQCYQLTGAGWTYKLAELKMLISKAVRYREEREMIQYESEVKLLALTLGNPNLNREQVLELLRKDGFDSTDHRIRTLWKHLGMRHKQRTQNRSFESYVKKLNSIHQKANDARRPISINFNEN